MTRRANSGPPLVFLDKVLLEHSQGSLVYVLSMPAFAL